MSLAATESRSSLRPGEFSRRNRKECFLANTTHARRRLSRSPPQQAWWQPGETRAIMTSEPDIVRRDWGLEWRGMAGNGGRGMGTASPGPRQPPWTGRMRSLLRPIDIPCEEHSATQPSPYVISARGYQQTASRVCIVLQCTHGVRRNVDFPPLSGVSRTRPHRSSAGVSSLVARTDDNNRCEWIIDEIAEPLRSTNTHG